MQVKTKIEKLREARDYSFLLSGDAEFPAPAKEPSVQKKPAPSSGVSWCPYVDYIFFLLSYVFTGRTYVGRSDV